MAASTNKKVVIRRFEREPVCGFVNPQTYLGPDGVEYLSLSGTLAKVAFVDIRTVDFVRDFNTADDPSEKKVFSTRPKTSGLWVRMRFRDGELMDGLLPNNLLQIESFGFTVLPPNSLSRRQRMFVPRQALEEIHVLGVVGSPLHPRQPSRAKAKEQISLFE